MRWAGHVARMREVRNACNILTGKPQHKMISYLSLGILSASWVVPESVLQQVGSLEMPFYSSERKEMDQ